MAPNPGTPATFALAAALLVLASALGLGLGRTPEQTPAAKYAYRTVQEDLEDLEDPVYPSDIADAVTEGWEVVTFSCDPHTPDAGWFLLRKPKG